MIPEVLAPADRVVGSGAIGQVVVGNFKIDADTEVEVSVDGVVKTLNVDYSVTRVEDADTFSITTLVAVAASSVIALLRKPSLGQVSNYEANEDLPNERLEGDFDKLFKAVQMLNEKLARAYLLKRHSIVSGEMDEPIAGRLARAKVGGGIDWVTTVPVGSLALPVSIADGGTGAITAAAARTALGIVAPSVDFNWSYNGDFEVWGAGVAAAPTGWTVVGAGATVAKNTTAGQFKIGTASVALTRVGTDCQLSQDVDLIQGFGPAARWIGKTLTFGCWVRATVANRGRLRLTDGPDASVSAYHSGGGAFEFLTVTHTMNAATTLVGLRFEVDNGDTTVQFDGAVLVIGVGVTDFIPSGWRGRKAVIPFQPSTSIAGGVTSYIGAGHLSASEIEVGIIMPFKCVARNLHGHLSVAPGGAQTMTYMIRKDLADTALTLVITGAATEGADVVNEVAFAKGDLMTLRGVASATAATTFAKGAVEVEEVP